MQASWPSGLSNSFSSTVSMPAVGQSIDITVTLGSSSGLATGSYPMEFRASLSAQTMVANYTLSVTPTSLGGYCAVNGSTSA